MIYLDNAATTKMFREALDSYIEVNEKFYGNTASINNYGKNNAKLLDASRRQIADILKVEQEKIYFTAGATESNNIAILGAAKHKKAFGNRIIVSKIEHPSVLETFRALEKEGFVLDYVSVDKMGRVDLVDLKRLLTKDTILLSVMQVNNVFGTIQPIAEIIEVLKDYPKVHFHVDGVQGVIKEEIDLSLIDSYSASAHKFHGPKGIGILYVKSRRTVNNVNYGGGQEDNLRSGTINLPSIVSMAKAMRLYSERIEEIKERHSVFKERIINELGSLKYLEINSPKDENFVDSIINISLPKIKGEAIINSLNEENVMVSTTSACSSKKFSVNEALYARGLSEENIKGSIRISLSYFTTSEDIDGFIKVFKDKYKQFEEVIESAI
ncbi:MULTISPECIES: cysteine desulfurase family protein [unclassified Gemella]|uniref:cysteine desulfurase family protein n=1 Tax=unclassified Gemella TaxID=2624949 RepID=UPI0010737363|nr:MULTISPECIES: cysteine desulfurase family protein [unclassified Gemella]MBF0709795.1 cysteine desulfurase [Gemella sp. GL1.1]MBF0747117.1 cysteine desulfurase [Gemella sp. 19428wG2_WT2a]NYS27139.1 cysteine desulfurase [Gemella sp. GL1]TFU58360.1 cysteine desulfurase [Gemella sp. WT2a]